MTDDGFWGWFAEKFDADPAGWISLLILVAGIVAASFWGRRIWHWVRGVPARIDAALRRRYAPALPVAQSTLRVRFERSLDRDPGRFREYGTHRLRGGLTVWSLSNLGPETVTNVWIELGAPTMQAETAMHWDTLAVDESVEFSAFVPFATDTTVTLHWEQSGRHQHRTLELLFQTGSRAET